MNNHNEEEKILLFGKKKIDVSNVPYGKISVLMDVWNSKRREHTEQLREFLYNNKEDDYKINKEYEDIQAVQISEFKALSDNIGMQLVRQPFEVLMRRFLPLRAIIEIIKRFFINHRVINNLNKEQYDAFDEWVHFTMTGKKKEDLVRRMSLLDLLELMEKDLETKTNLDLEKCVELLRTSRGVIVESLTTSIQDHKA